MSIIQEQEFLSKLYAIQSLNPPSQVLFPESKGVYDIDLSTRVIDAPAHLSVSKDHESETIYFRVDRFHDYMDLANTTCVVQYITPDKKAHLYVVPFYDIVTEREDKKMLFPWCVDGNVTRQSGIVQFSIRFFIAKESQEDGTIEHKLVYNLTTLPAQSEILNGMEVSELESDYDISASAYDELLTLIKSLEREEAVYWDIVEEE